MFNAIFSLPYITLSLVRKNDEEECDRRSGERVNVWWANLRTSKCVITLKIWHFFGRVWVWYTVMCHGTERVAHHIRCATALRSVAHYRCDVPGGVGAWHITWFALARMIWHSKNFLPHFARPIFFFCASTLYNKLPVPPNANGNEEEYAERTNIFYTRRNTVLEYYFQ